MYFFGHPMENENTRGILKTTIMDFFSAGWEVRSWKMKNTRMDFLGIQWRMKTRGWTLKNTFKEVLSGGWRYDLGKMIMR